MEDCAAANKEGKLRRGGGYLSKARTWFVRDYRREMGGEKFELKCSARGRGGGNNNSKNHVGT